MLFDYAFVLIISILDDRESEKGLPRQRRALLLGVLERTPRSYQRNIRRAESRFLWVASHMCSCTRDSPQEILGFPIPSPAATRIRLSIREDFSRPQHLECPSKAAILTEFDPDQEGRRETVAAISGTIYRSLLGSGSKPNED